MLQVPRRVRIITDSSADLPADLAARWGIEVVPLYVHFGEQSFRDGVDLTVEGFTARLFAGEFPRTSQPSIGMFKRIYEHAVAGGGEAVSIHLSSALSGTVQSALLASDQVDGRVAVVDTGQLSMAIGWLVLAAAEAAREGRPLEEIVALVEEMKRRVYVRALLESLEHLRRGGRIGRAQELIGSLLDIRPIVGLEKGVLAVYDRVRSRRAGLRRLVEVVAAEGTLERVAVMHVGCPQDALAVADALTPAFPRDQILVLPAGQVVATHVGPQAVGVGYVVAP